MDESEKASGAFAFISPQGSDGSRYPSRKCPNAASGRIRSQMILVIASIGTERIAPGAPHIQNQKTSEMITRTGLRMNRLAFDQVNCEIKPSRQERLPKRVTGQQANEHKDHHAQDRAKNWHEVQQESDRPPEDRVADPRKPHDHCRANTDCGVHERNGDEIRRDIPFDLLKDIDGLPLIAEAWQYLDESAEEGVTRHKQEKQKQNRRKESAGKISGAGEELCYERRAFRRNSGGCS